MNFQFKDNNMHRHWSLFKSYSLFTTIWYLDNVLSPMYSAGSCSVAKEPFTKYMMLFLLIFYPSLPPCDSVWQLAVQLIVRYVTVTKKNKYLQNKNLICNNRFKTLSINRHYFNALLNLCLNSCTLRLGRKHWFVIYTYLQASRSCFVTNMYTISPIRVYVTWYRLWYLPPLVALCDFWSNTPFPQERHVFCEWPLVEENLSKKTYARDTL
jgi:hypothetical protein